MKKVLLLFLFLSIDQGLHAQQDSQFTQYIFNGLHINPAYAGTKGDYYIQSSYRSQWQGVTGAPKSFSIAADGSFYNGNVGLGLIIANDQIGAQSSLTAFANYAYHLKLDEEGTSALSFGLAAGMMQMGINGSKLIEISPGDGAVNPYMSQTRTYPDARFGIYYSGKKYFAGISATNLVARYMSGKQNDNFLVPIPEPHFYLTAGALFPLSDDVHIKPSILVKDDFKGTTAVDFNAFFLIKERVWIGGFYRGSYNLHNSNLQLNLPTNNSIGLITEIFATPDLRIGYSYDYSLGKLRGYGSGSHEISAGLYLNKKDDRKARLTRCYVF